MAMTFEPKPGDWVALRGNREPSGRVYWRPGLVLRLTKTQIVIRDAYYPRSESRWDRTSGKSRGGVTMTNWIAHRPDPAWIVGGSVKNSIMVAQALEAWAEADAAQ